MSTDRAFDPSGDDRAAERRREQPGAEGNAEARTRIDVPWSVYAKAIVAVLLTVGLIRFFQQITAVLVIIALALFLTAVLSPLAARLQRLGLGRGLASLVAVAAAVIVILALLSLVVPPLVIQGVEFAEDLPNQLLRLRRWAAAYPAVFEELERRALAIREDPAAFFTGFLRFGAGAASVVVSAVLILTLALYFLVDQERVRSAVIDRFPARHRDRMDRTITEVGRVIRSYFTGQAIISSIFALVTFLVLTILGVPYATVLAAVAFFLDAIPNIGATLATVVPALVALGSEGLTDALIVAAVFPVYQQIENNVIAPRILGEKLEIPPVLTLVAILIGGAVLGVIGIVLAIPLAGTLPVIDRIWIRGRGAEPEDGTAGVERPERKLGPPPAAA